MNGRKRVPSPARRVVMWTSSGFGGEVDEGAALEAEERRVGVAVLLVLADGVVPGLAGHRVLELARSPPARR